MVHFYYYYYSHITCDKYYYRYSLCCTSRSKIATVAATTKASATAATAPKLYFNHGLKYWPHTHTAVVQVMHMFPAVVQVMHMLPAVVQVMHMLPAVVQVMHMLPAASFSVSQVCKHGLYTLLRAVHRAQDPARTSAACSILTNIHYHPDNATTLYKAELKLKHAALLQVGRREGEGRGMKGGGGQGYEGRGRRVQKGWREGCVCVCVCDSCSRDPLLSLHPPLLLKLRGLVKKERVRVLPINANHFKKSGTGGKDSTSEVREGRVSAQLGGGGSWWGVCVGGRGREEGMLLTPCPLVLVPASHPPPIPLVTPSL